jgi:uncharacterized small protein (DUF1192 family)
MAAPRLLDIAPHKNRTTRRAPLLTDWLGGSTLRFMDMDDYPPKRADDPLAQLQRQDLDPLSVSDLEQRIIVLEAEIGRTRSKIEYAVNHKASAEALFKR